MITGIIYKYTSPSNKIYVGKTINESERKHALREVEEVSLKDLTECPIA